MVPANWKQLRDDFQTDYMRRPNPTILHALQLRVGISVEEPPDEWQLLLEFCLGASGPTRHWNAAPRSDTVRGPMHCVFGDADGATRNLLFDACDLIGTDSHLAPYHTDNLMLWLYLIAWERPEEVSYLIKQRAFRPNDKRLSLNPFGTLNAFEKWECDGCKLPKGRYFLWLNRDVRLCAVSAIDVVFSEGGASSARETKWAKLRLEIDRFNKTNGRMPTRRDDAETVTGTYNRAWDNKRRDKNSSSQWPTAKARDVQQVARDMSKGK